MLVFIEEEDEWREEWEFSRDDAVFINLRGAKNEKEMWEELSLNLNSLDGEVAPAGNLSSFRDYYPEWLRRNFDSKEEIVLLGGDRIAEFGVTTLAWVSFILYLGIVEHVLQDQKIKKNEKLDRLQEISIMIVMK